MATLLKQGDEIGRREGDVWFLLHRRWWDRWCAYTGFGTADADSEGSPDPGKAPRAWHPRCISERGRRITPPSLPAGPIDNTPLLAAEAGNGGKDASRALPPTGGAELPRLPVRWGVREGDDFVLLPDQAWRALHDWFGGGPALARPVARGNGETPTVQLFTVRDMATRPPIHQPFPCSTAVPCPPFPFPIALAQPVAPDRTPSARRRRGRKTRPMSEPAARGWRIAATLRRSRPRRKRRSSMRRQRSLRTGPQRPAWPAGSPRAPAASSAVSRGAASPLPSPGPPPLSRPLNVAGRAGTAAATARCRTGATTNGAAHPRRGTLLPSRGPCCWAGEASWAWPTWATPAS